MIIDLLVSNYRILLRAFGNTLTIALISLVFATLIGLISSLMNLSRSRILRAVSRFYVALIRGVPMIVLAFMVYFGLPYLLKKMGVSGFRIPVYTASLITMSLNAGAYMSEIIRGGIQAVDPGQSEAARSLGLPYNKTMRLIIVPQAIKTMVPAIINQFIISFKDTSLLSVIGFAELTNQTQVIIGRTNAIFEMWAIAGVLYFVSCTLLGQLGKVVERKLANGN